MTSSATKFSAIGDTSDIVADAVTTCKYALANKPVPGQEIEVSIGGVSATIPNDPSMTSGDGSYDAVSNTITFGEKLCYELGKTSPNDIEVELLCPPPAVE